MSRISVFSLHDGLRAYLQVTQLYGIEYPTVKEILDELKDYGVVFGVKTDVIVHMVHKEVYDRRILVAEGKPPQAGTDGRLEILIDIKGIGRPQEREDGSVDHKELKKVINVTSGQPLVRRIPPQPGENGRSVLGKLIFPPAVADVLLRPAAGTSISEEDPNLLVAETDGAVSRNAVGDIEVKTVKVITGDIDYATGNITFSGDLKITGVVRAGFSVKAEGNCLICGHVEDARVSSTGNMEILGGAVGSHNGKLICGGALKVHHIENFEVQARNTVTVFDTILHTSIQTEDMVKAKTIVGGKIEATHGIVAETIGAASETKTMLKVGSIHFLLQQKKILNEKIQELTSTLTNSKEEAYAVVKNGMDTTGKLAEEEIIKLDELKEDIAKVYTQFSSLDQRLVEIEANIRENPNPVIKARVIFPNIIIRFGLLEKIISEKVTSSIISADEHTIIIRRE